MTGWYYLIAGPQIIMDDEKNPEQERADRLREKIERLKNPPETELEEPAEEDAAPSSPRDFIHQRMRELDESDDSGFPPTRE